MPGMRLQDFKDGTLKLPKLVIVEWLDSAGSPEPWLEEVPAVAECVSAGWLMHRDKHQVTVCHSYAIGGSFGGGISIPMGCVKRIKTLGGKQ